MPAVSEQISADVAPIHFVGAAIQAARCRLLAHRQSMSHRSASRSEGRKLADGRFHYRRSFDIPSVCLTAALANCMLRCISSLTRLNHYKEIIPFRVTLW
jgi:hypothetical protein